VQDGIVQGYFLGSYSARKLGMTTTGNAGGNHNLVVAPTARDLPRS
jgi:PmbA protein